MAEHGRPHGHGLTFGYDCLVIASGTTPRPDPTPGMLESQWRLSIVDFSTLDGAKALATALEAFDHGRLAQGSRRHPCRGMADWALLTAHTFDPRGMSVTDDRLIPQQVLSEDIER